MLSGCQKSRYEFQLSGMCTEHMHTCKCEEEIAYITMATEVQVCMHVSNSIEEMASITF